VVAALALAEGRPIDLDTLAGPVWTDDQRPANPVAGLHVYISVLRRVLEPQRAARARPQVLVTSSGGYALAPAHVRIDVVDVAQVATRAQRLLSEPLITWCRRSDSGLTSWSPCWRTSTRHSVAGAASRTSTWSRRSR
jgi:hypothetical protein